MARPPRRRVGSGRALATLLVVLTATACGAGDGAGKPNAGPPPPSISAMPTDPPVEVVGLPDDVELVVSDPEVGVENGENLSFVSPVFALTPGGPLDQPVTVRVLLDNALPTSSAVLAAVRASPDQPWRYLPGTLTSDQQHVEFATTHLEEVGILSIDLDGALASFQEDIRTGLASRIDRKLDKPVCAGEEDALKNGYRVAASKSNTLFWCFGLENDKRVVKVTNRRPSAVEIAHPGVVVLENPQAVKAWDHWSGALGTTNSFVPPGRSATYDADLAPKTRAPPERRDLGSGAVAEPAAGDGRCDLVAPGRVRSRSREGRRDGQRPPGEAAVCEDAGQGKRCPDRRLLLEAQADRDEIQAASRVGRRAAAVPRTGVDRARQRRTSQCGRG